MSYTADAMNNLARALRDTEGLKYSIKKFNNNIEVLERLAKAIERQNELKEIELGLEKGKQKTIEIIPGYHTRNN